MREWATPLRLCVSIFPVILSLLLAACTSLVQKSGDVLEGQAFAEKTVAAYRTIDNDPKIELKEIKSKDGEETIEITNSAWPSLALRGTRGAEDNFHLTEARFLSSHVNGWNEFTLDLLGSGFYSSHGILYIEKDLERVQISSGKIRLKGNRITGASALVPLRNRRERILVLTEWMKEWQNKTGNSISFSGQKEFENYWKPRLFPELVLAKKRPTEYSSILNAEKQNTEWRRADGIKWNLNYTEYLLPKELRELRNSGALLRDWEEAQPWIFMEYSWDMIVNSYCEKELRKIK